MSSEGPRGVPVGRMAGAADPLRLAVLISGRGSNMRAIVAAARKNEIPARVEFVASDRADAPGIAWALSEGVAVWAAGRPFKEDPDGFYRRLADDLVRLDVEVIALAGFMRILPAWMVERFSLRILNIHPSLLPSFPGLHPHRQALEHGVKRSGCTVHLVDTGVDTGPILLQEAVPVYDDDDERTLADRILQVEHRLYPEAIRLMGSGRLELRGRRIVQATPST